jgi:AcrR family transcriptional regulator
MPPLETNGPGTDQALLRAAGEVFADRGYRGATVREICRRAGANVAAVNYHFGGKQALYTAVLKHAYRCALEKHPSDFGVSPGALPEDRLRAFVRSLITRVMEEGPGSWRGRLIAREMVEPTSALDRLVREEIRPQADLLGSIVQEILGPSASEATVRLCGCSIMSQCTFYFNCQPVLQRLFPQQSLSPSSVDKLADHIVTFSLAALRQYPAGRR